MCEKTFNFTIEPWSIVHENKEYQTPIFNLLSRKMRLEAEGEHKEGIFYVLDAPEWVNVIPITEANEVVLVEQYRYGVEEPTLEIPGGMVDPGEAPQTAIQRELAEETGYVSESWSSLGKVSSNPAIMNNFTHLFLAKSCRFEGFKEAHGDEHERINIHTMPVERFLSLAADGTVHHTIVLAAVARYLLKVKSQM